MRILPLIALVTVLAGTAFGPSATAAAAPPDPCAIRTPILGDYDGDAVPDTAIGALGGSGARFWVQPSGGSTGAWVTGTSFVDFDLDGDACSDAVVTDGATVRVLPGTKNGLDQSAAVPVPVPQTDALGADETLRISAIGIRNHRFVQVIVAGVHVRAGKESAPFVNISTRQSTGEFAPPLTYRGAILGKGDAAGFATPTALSGSGTSFVVGAPATSVRGHGAAGAAYLFAGQDDGSYWIEPVSQDDSWIAGKPESGDRFGASVSIRGHWVAIGAPGESIGNDSRTGLVQPLYWDGEKLSMRAYRAIHQDLSGVPGANEDGDNFGREVLVARGLTGSGSYDVLISAREKIGKQSAAGSVTLANLTKAKFRTYHQATAGVPGSPRSGNDFGTLATLRTSPQLDTVLIGAPGEDATGCPDCGYVIRSDSRTLSSHTAWKLIAPAGTDVSGTTRWGRAFARS